MKAKADANERLHPAKVTDNARVILALTAIGKDVTNVGGHNLLKGLDNMDYVQTQDINGPISPSLPWIATTTPLWAM